MKRSSDSNTYLFTLHRYALPKVQEMYYKLNDLLSELSKFTKSYFTTKEWESLMFLTMLTAQSLTVESLHELVKRFLRIDTTNNLEQGDFSHKIDAIRNIYTSIGVDLTEFDGTTVNNTKQVSEIHSTCSARINDIKDAEAKAMHLSPAEGDEVFAEHIKEFRRLYSVNVQYKDFNDEQIMLFNDYYAGLGAGFYFLPMSSSKPLSKFFCDPNNVVLTSYRYNVCAVCGQSADDPHHLDVDRSSTGDKDKRIVRLCRTHHRLLHDTDGTNRFLQESGLDGVTLTGGQIWNALGDDKGEAIHLLDGLHGKNTD